MLPSLGWPLAIPAWASHATRRCNAPHPHRAAARRRRDAFGGGADPGAHAAGRAGRARRRGRDPSCRHGGRALREGRDAGVCWTWTLHRRSPIPRARRRHLTRCGGFAASERCLRRRLRARQAVQGRARDGGVPRSAERLARSTRQRADSRRGDMYGERLGDADVLRRAHAALERSTLSRCPQRSSSSPPRLHTNTTGDGRDPSRHGAHVRRRSWSHLHVRQRPACRRPGPPPQSPRATMKPSRTQADAGTRSPKPRRGGAEAPPTSPPPSTQAHLPEPTRGLEPRTPTLQRMTTCCTKQQTAMFVSGPRPRQPEQSDRSWRWLGHRWRC